MPSECLRCVRAVAAKKLRCGNDRFTCRTCVNKRLGERVMVMVHVLRVRVDVCVCVCVCVCVLPSQDLCSTPLLNATNVIDRVCPCSLQLPHNDHVVVTARREVCAIG